MDRVLLHAMACLLSLEVVLPSRSASASPQEQGASAPSRRAVPPAEPVQRADPRGARSHGADSLRADSAIAVIDRLESVVERRSSYAALCDDRWRRSLRELRRSVVGPISRHDLAQGLSRALARVGDGHASIDGGGRTPDGALPFIAVPLHGGDKAPIVAVRTDLVELLDPQRPFVASLDGVPIQRWLEVAGETCADGPPQRVRSRACAALRRFADMAARRRQIDGPAPVEVPGVVVVALAATEAPPASMGLKLPASDGAEGPTLLLPLAERASGTAVGPRRSSGHLEDGTAYLRLARMDEDAAREAKRLLDTLGAGQPLVIDVRGNPGGTREALWTVAAGLLPRDAEPVVCNAARPLLVDGVVPEELSAALLDRRLRAIDDPAWTPAERAAAERFAAACAPAVPIDDARFGPLHVAILSPHPTGPATARRTAVLCDPRSFSAADIFLAAMKAVPGTRLFGQPSGGGSGAALSHDLGEGFTVRLSSMVSFSADGRLFDQTGVEPDVLVVPDPRDFTLEGPDRTLGAALDWLRQPPGPDDR